MVILVESNLLTLLWQDHSFNIECSTSSSSVNSRLSSSSRALRLSCVCSYLHNRNTYDTVKNDNTMGTGFIHLSLGMRP